MESVLPKTMLSASRPARTFRQVGSSPHQHERGLVQRESLSLCQAVQAGAELLVKSSDRDLIQGRNLL